MKALDKQQSDRHSQLAASLTNAREELNVAISEFNEEVKALFEKDVRPKIDALNATVTEANEFANEVHTDQETYYDEKSEKWQESDVGVEYHDWMDQWEQELEEVDLDPPEEIDEPDVDVSTFEQLPEELP